VTDPNRAPVLDASSNIMDQYPFGEGVLQPAQTSPLDPLALTEREAAVVVSWKERPVIGAPETDQEIGRGFLSTPLGRLTTGTAASVTGIAGGFAAQAIPAMAQPNQIPAPAAKVAKPFEINTEENVPTLFSDTDSDTAVISEQQCVNDAVARPEIRNTQIKHAGAPGTQDMYAQIINQALDCGDEFNVLRTERFRFRVQDAVHRTRWITFLQPGFNLLTKSNERGTSVAHLIAGVVGRNKNQGLYECTEGPETTGAKFDLKMTAKDKMTRETLDTKTYTTQIEKIFPKSC
jgi:hypothetical protein